MAVLGCRRRRPGLCPRCIFVSGADPYRGGSGCRIRCRGEAWRHIVRMLHPAYPNIEVSGKATMEVSHLTPI